MGMRSWIYKSDCNFGKRGNSLKVVFEWWGSMGGPISDKAVSVGRTPSLKRTHMPYLHVLKDGLSSNSRSIHFPCMVVCHQFLGNHPGLLPSRLWLKYLEQLLF